MDQEIEMETVWIDSEYRISKPTIDSLGKPHLVVNNGITIFRNDPSRAEMIVKEWRDSYGKI